MAHLHNIYDSDIHFKLDSKTRTFSNETELKLLVGQGDHNSEIFTFEIPRYIEQHDMLKCNRIEIHYMNISSTTRDTSRDVYYAEDLQVSPEDENIVIFSWPLRGNATKYNGSLSFSISFKCLEGDEITYSWNTLIYSKISVGKSLNNVETIAQEYSDVLEKWKKEVLENINPTVTIDTELNEESDNAIANCTVAKKISQLSDSKVDKQDGYSMVTDTEKETWNNKSNFSGSYEDLTDTPTIPSEYTLPIATPTTLGGVKPVTKTDEMTQEVGVDELGGLFTKEGGSSGDGWVKLIETTVEEDVQTVIISEDMNGNSIDCDELEVFYNFVGTESNTTEQPVEVKILNNKNNLNGSYLTKLALNYAQRKSGSVYSHTSTKFAYDETNNITVGYIMGSSGLETVYSSNSMATGLNTIIGIRLWAYTEYIGKGTSIIAYGKKR